jgi:hypothetical protein
LIRAWNVGRAKVSDHRTRSNEATLNVIEEFLIAKNGSIPLDFMIRTD